MWQASQVPARDQKGAIEIGASTMQAGCIGRHLGYDFSNPFYAHECIQDEHISVSTTSVLSNSDNI
jgi:hypothetical protein